MVSQQATTLAWLRSVLSGDSTLIGLGTPALNSGTAAGGPLRIWAGAVPQGFDLPSLRYDVLSYRDVVGLGLHRCGGRAIVVLAAVGNGRDLSAIEPLYARADAVVSGTPQPVSYGGVQLVCERTEQYVLRPVLDGKEYLEWGGRYEVTLTGFA